MQKQRFLATNIRSKELENRKRIPRRNNRQFN